MPPAGLGPDRETVIDGIAGLVYRDKSCDLAIADYKTDIGVSSATVEEYRLQLVMHASLLEGVTGETAYSLRLIFCRTGGATVLDRHRGCPACKRAILAIRPSKQVVRNPAMSYRPELLRCRGSLQRGGEYQSARAGLTSHLHGQSGERG